MSSTINQAFINNMPKISLGILGLSFASPMIDKDEKYINQDTLKKLSYSVFAIEQVVAFSRYAVAPPLYIFSISTFALARLFACAVDHVTHNRIDFYKKHGITIGVPVLDDLAQEAVKILSSIHFRNFARSLFDSFTSLWFFQSLFLAHKQGTAPHISLPFCALGLLASDTLINKSVEVLDPKRKWAKQEVENDLSYTIKSIFYNLLASGCLLTLIPPESATPIPMPFHFA